VAPGGRDAVSSPPATAEVLEAFVEDNLDLLVDPRISLGT